MEAVTQGILAIVCITIIALMCIYKGIDGNILLACILGVCGLGGYELYAAKKAQEIV